MQTIPFWKIAATLGGAGLTGAAVWLNAEHIAEAEGWSSPLVAAGVIVTLCAAAAPPLAERAGKTGQPMKAAMLWIFFGLAVAFSLSASIARSSGYVADKIASAEGSNKSAALAEEAYEALKNAVAAECVKRGPKCRELEARRDAARETLANAAPVQAADPGSQRLAAVLGIEEASVQLYVPLFLPLGLELGGFIFLAFGLAPRARKIAIEPVAKPVQAVATRNDTVAKLMADAAKPAAVGTRAYYLARLEREFPAIAKRVHAGKLSVFAGCVEAGIRKAPAKRSKWTQIDAYAPAEADA